MNGRSHYIAFGGGFDHAPILRAQACADYEIIGMVHPPDWGFVRDLRGSPRLPSWRPLQVELAAADDLSGCKRSDLPWLGHRAIGMRQSAVDALHDILDGQGELLPLWAGEVQLYGFHPRAVPALDRQRSTITFLPSGPIFDIPKPVFVPAAVRGIDVFMLPENHTAYVSSRFVDRVRAAGLVGLHFDEIWAEAG